jgi:large subunit ribosomal protein L13
MVGS